jgi:thiol-disulfide isomerase/thioredoxin
MSFNIYLFAFKDNKIDFRVREEIVLQFKNNENISSSENTYFEYHPKDHGRAEFNFEDSAMVSSIDVNIGSLSLSLVEYLFDLLKSWNLFLFDNQGTNNEEHPTLFALSEDDFSHLPYDFTSPFCVIENANDLYDYLAISFNEWSKYRDQVIGKKSLNDDARSLFDIITAAVSSQLRESLWNQIDKKIEKKALEDLFNDVFSSMDNKKKWIWLQVDVRDYKEVQWQAVAIAKTIGLIEECPDFTKERKNQVSDSKTLNALLNFDLWLSKFKKSFILLDGSDTYFGFVIFDDELEYTLNLLQNIGIRAQAIRQINLNKEIVAKQDSKLELELELLSPLDEKSLSNDVVILKISPNDKNTKKRMVEYRKIILEAGKIPLICISASWCEPCQEMLLALQHDDAKSLMKQIVLILLDIDDWGIYLYDIKITPTCVPVFFDIGKNGSSGKLSVDGGAWGDDSLPSEIVAVLKNTFKLK